MTSHLRELSDVSIAARRNGDDAPAQSAGRRACALAVDFGAACKWFSGRNMQPNNLNPSATDVAN
ncbi:hypothetical protein EYF80_048536 [Liparis tanakae]|uniref:Uncharacterized protein n=1 Tax=Liparis tanakae TaxID=230148 RepID=A0A4Z2FJD4_9TELE|nr:hypothetical protein EYF80_048536 [Liparis tanakae]